MLVTLLLVSVYCFQDYDALCRLIVNGSSSVLTYTLIHEINQKLNYFYLYVIFNIHVVTNNKLEIIHSTAAYYLQLSQNVSHDCSIFIFGMKP